MFFRRIEEKYPNSLASRESQASFVAFCENSDSVQEFRWPHYLHTEPLGSGCGWGNPLFEKSIFLFRRWFFLLRW
jgi:hypothetical protein